MDGSQFDTLTRAVSATPSRRRLLALLSIMPVAGGLSVLFEEGSEAKRPGKNRRNHNHRHSGRRKDKREKRQDARQGDGGPQERGCEGLLTQAGCVLVNEFGAIVWQCPFNCYLEFADLTNCDFTGAHFEGCFLKGAQFHHSILDRAHFDSAQAEGVDMNFAYLRGTKFIDTNLGSASKFQYAQAQDADFTRASLNAARMYHANLRGAIFESADLRNVGWKPDDSPRTVCPDGSELHGDSCCGHLNGYTTPYCD